MIRPFVDPCHKPIRSVRIVLVFMSMLFWRRACYNKTSIGGLFFMDLPTVLFWIIAVILVGSALLVVGLRNIVHSALALVVLFGMAAGIYLLLNAEFIAIVQVLIYAGAVTILILFALMLTRTRNLSTNSNPTNRQWWLAAIISTLVGAAIIFA